MLVLTVTRLIDVDQAFAILRDQARNRNQRLSDLARGPLAHGGVDVAVAGGDLRCAGKSVTTAWGRDSLASFRTPVPPRSPVAGRLVVTMLSCRPLEVTSAPLADVTAHPPFLPDGGGARR